jgi:hypothetical protein
MGHWHWHQMAFAWTSLWRPEGIGNGPKHRVAET